MNLPSLMQRPFMPFALTVLVLGGLLTLYGYEFYRPTSQFDDSYISYRYAQNLVDGHGLVFNIGERVEGYTNLLWTVMVAGGIALGGSAPLVGHWLDFSSGILLLLATWFYALSLLPTEKKGLALAAPMLLYASNSFASWTISGLETHLYAAWVTAALTAFTINRMNWVLVFCILASLTRPEGVLLAALLLGFDWLTQIVRQRPKQLPNLLRLSRPCLVYLLFIAGLTAFRVQYYGDVLPNTFYAKTGNIPLHYGLAYINRFFMDGAILLLIPALVGLRSKSYRIGFAFFALIVIYVIAVGGDHFRHGRFLLPVLPILIAGALVGIAKMGKTSTKLGLLTALVLPTFVLGSLYSPWPRNTEYAHPKKLEIVSALPFSAKRENAKLNTRQSEQLIKDWITQLRKLDPPAQSVAAMGIGQLGYLAREVMIIDMAGLTDHHIARSDKQVDGTYSIPGHQKSDASYVLSRRPDVIYIPKIGENSLIPAVKSLHDEPRLSQEYLWDDQLTAYVRRAELQPLTMQAQ